MYLRQSFGTKLMTIQQGGSVRSAHANYLTTIESRDAVISIIVKAKSIYHYARILMKLTTAEHWYTNIAITEHVAYRSRQRHSGIYQSIIASSYWKCRRACRKNALYPRFCCLCFLSFLKNTSLSRRGASFHGNVCQSPLFWSEMLLMRYTLMRESVVSY